MKTLRITGVPEHFNFPFLLLEKEQPLREHGVNIQWINESRGSGQMNLALRADETDLAVLLTESFLKDFEAGNPSRMVGYHVASPLTWGIHIRSTSPVNHLNELEKKHFLVSRMGSGSHLMALVLAKSAGWNAAELTYEIVGNMDGAKEAMDMGNEGMFLWEKFTTAPMILNGTMKRIGEVPSPWSCFVIVASEKAISTYGDLIFLLRDHLYRISKSLENKQNLSKILSDQYQLEESDVKEWLAQTRWATEPDLSKNELESSMKIMNELGIIRSKLPLDRFLVLDRLNLIG